MTTQEKQELYALLRKHYAVGETCMMAQMSSYLAQNGVSASKYGYAKAKNMYLDCPEFIAVEDMHIGEYVHQSVTLLAWENEGASAMQIHQVQQDCSAAQAHDNVPETAHIECDVQRPSEGLLQGAFADLINIPAKTLYAYANMTGQNNEEAYEQLRICFERARDTLQAHEGKLAFDTPMAQIVLVPSLYENMRPWHLTFSLKEGVQRRDTVPSAQSAGTLTDQDKREVYRVLQEALPLNEKLHMATVSKLLNDRGMTRERYGFAKMKAFLQAMPEFLDFEETIMGGVPQTLVIVRPMPMWDTDNTPAQMVQPYEDVPAQVDGFVKLPMKTLTILNALMTGQEQVPPQQVIETLKHSYADAVAEGKLRKEENFYSFETGLNDRNGNSIEASIKRTSYGEYPWFLSYVGSKRSKQNNAPGKMLEQFAFLGSWQSFLKALADMALAEPWDFGERDGEHREYFILQKYIQYTFYRLTLEDKVLESDDGTFAAFNTGLVTAHYDDIYACFEASEGDYATKWRFLEFCTKGRRGTGKRLVDCFNPLPQPASYFERKEDLLFDLEKDLHTDYDHILLDNVSRLPISFLQEECRGFGDALSCIQRAQQTVGFERKQAFRALAQCIDEDPLLFNRLRNRIADAIELAKKQVRWNFKTAIPCYFPTRNIMSLMLPLSLRGDGVADVALVVELMRSGNYQGQTILTLQQAYIDGRLLCRPNSDWLDTHIMRQEDDTAHDEADNL